ncbi:MAG TPA: transglutaminase domain-containing protein, partial [Candidatus Marinimicrobia bacterium]|nr:transglutaminase domain-containing protein [Candidatus Neomarinimicrobiota bacterium]
MIKNIHRIIGLLCLIIWIDCEGSDYRALIETGEFKKAEEMIRRELFSNQSLSVSERRTLEFELERMRRIRLDFNKSQAEVIEYIKQYVPDVTPTDLVRWESEKSLEYLVIDGEKMYFKDAAPNLFR